ncbi:MAG: tail needle knob protein [Citrobacter freundii]|nr:tail needle knob protein [Citrobacter freundii]MDU1699294.1 tail needle knob protein [Citrobacter freundii]MDU1733906.1 tail needle knob protein [Citrobacter freundii]MDU1816012.1 tail needle knob protein [Citrobacter freundii]MDU7723274.1 tail needle knob protein [Citrobacter sp.]
MADPSLNTPVIIQATRLDASILPRNVFSQSYLLYVIAQGTDVGAIAGKANEAGQGAYDAQVKNDEQDVTLADHEGRITANTLAIQLLDTRLTTAEGKIDVLRNDVDLLIDEVSDIETTLANHETRITANEAELANHETRIAALEYATTRKKSEVVYTGISQVIPTTPTNLITMLKALTPSSGILTPFFNTTTDKLTAYNENKTLNFKLSMIGSYPGGTTNRSMQLTFSGAVPDTLVASRNAATTTDNILLATFFSVDQGGFLATNGSTITIQANGAAFTATTIKIIAEQ